MHDKDTEVGLSLDTLDAMQLHREGEETSFHPVLTGSQYERPPAPNTGLSDLIGGVLLLFLFVLYAFSGNL